MVSERFIWEAELLDGTIIKEIDSAGKEHLFQEVIDILDKVKILTLSWNDKFASVNLINGHFDINGTDLGFKGISDLENVKYKLIYFKRVKQILSTSGTDKIDNIKYHLGFQVNIDGKNYQRILLIDNDSRNTEFIEKNIRVESL